MLVPLRFKDIAAAFRSRSGLDKELDGQATTSLNHQLDTDHSLQDSLLFYAAEHDPQKYVDSFDKLVAFVDASLDLYRVRACWLATAQQRHGCWSSSKDCARACLQGEAAAACYAAATHTSQCVAC